MRRQPTPLFAHLASVYYNFGWSGPAEMAREAADISEQVLQNKTTSVTGQGAFPGYYCSSRESLR
ncbi:MAG: hypothetical protein ACERLB_12510 [Gammaproteobacteria bacterium]